MVAAVAAGAAASCGLFVPVVWRAHSGLLGFLVIGIDICRPHPTQTRMGSCDACSVYPLSVLRTWHGSSPPPAAFVGIATSSTCIKARPTHTACIYLS